MSILVKNIIRGSKCPEERSYQAISIGLDTKPDSYLILAEDGYYPKTFNLHFHGIHLLSEYEVDSVLDALVAYLQPGTYLARAGESIPEEHGWWMKLTYKLEETTAIRVLHSRYNHLEKTYWKILKKQ